MGITRCPSLKMCQCCSRKFTLASERRVKSEECVYLQGLIHLSSSQLVRGGQKHPLFGHHWGQASPGKAKNVKNNYNAPIWIVSTKDTESKMEYKTPFPYFLLLKFYSLFICWSMQCVCLIIQSLVYSVIAVSHLFLNRPTRGSCAYVNIRFTSVWLDTPPPDNCTVRTHITRYPVITPLVVYCGNFI